MDISLIKKTTISIVMFIAIFLLYTSDSYAENINNYTPPPMFGEKIVKIKPPIKYFPKPVKKTSIKKYTNMHPRPHPRPKGLLRTARKTMPAVAPKEIAKEILLDDITLIDKKNNESKNPPDNKSISMISEKDTNKATYSDLTISYNTGKTELDSNSESLITDKILLPMFKNNDIRLQILSYATAGDNGQSSDRRYSLSRALNIKNWLQSRGIDQSKISIRALGNNTELPNKDRVDFIFITSN